MLQQLNKIQSSRYVRYVFQNKVFEKRSKSSFSWLSAQGFGRISIFSPLLCSIYEKSPQPSFAAGVGRRNDPKHRTGVKLTEFNGWTGHLIAQTSSLQVTIHKPKRGSYGGLNVNGHACHWVRTTFDWQYGPPILRLWFQWKGTTLVIDYVHRIAVSVESEQFSIIIIIIFCDLIF